MAQTVTLGSGGFVIDNTTDPGTQLLSPTPSNFNTSSGDPSYTFQNSNNSEIKGLGFEDATPGGLTLNVTSESNVTASDSTFSMGIGGDTLVIGSSKANNFFMSDGDNSLTFTYRSNSDVVNFGTGADTLVFGGPISNTTVQLSVDSSVDTIRIAQSTTPVTGLKITGATDIDVLFIGTTQYNYTSSEGAWVNTTDPNDKKFFN